MIMYIEDHQDLLNRYYMAQVSLIGEYSSDIDGDTDKLNKEVEEYAKRMELQSPVED